MKKLPLLYLFLSFLIGSNTLFAQNSDPNTVFKNHLNSIVQKVGQADDAVTKREILNSSLTNLTNAVEKVEKMNSVSSEDKVALAKFKDGIKSKKDELNGLNDFNRVKDGQLNNFATYVLQDFEQADKTVTFSVTTLLLIIIILILL
jgi:hypothetical protein